MVVLKKILTLSLLVLLPISVFGVQFSATAIMSIPGRADSTSKVYVAPNKIRKEFYYYGEPVIQILNSKQNTSLMCFSSQAVCYENEYFDDIDLGLSKANPNPCVGQKKVTCKKVAEEIFNKRKTYKWKLSEKTGETVSSSLLWVDAELNIPVKTSLKSNIKSELIWQGEESVNQRKTQKWLEIVTQQGKKPMKRQQWFDTELKISIKQAYPNGQSQELRAISIQKLDQDIFNMPIGFVKKTSTK